LRLRRTPKPASGPQTALHATLAPNARQLVRNLLVRHDGVVEAGYRIGPARWGYLGLTQQQLTLDAVTDGYANLLGRDYRERVTTRPHPVADWARRLHARTPHPAPDVPGETWNDFLVRQQLRIGSGMDDRVVFRHLAIGTVEPDVDVLAEIVAFVRESKTPSEQVRALLAEEKRVSDAVRARGWSGAAMTEREQAWLLRRTLAPGMPAPMTPESGNGWATGDLPALASDVRWLETPFDRTVEVHAWRDGKETVRAVQVLACAQMSDLNYPENGLEPWQAYAERAVDPTGASFGIEWSITGRLATGAELAGRAEKDLRTAIYTERQYHQWDEPPPEYTARGIARAAEARDQITTGQASESGRYVGTVNMIIVGEEIKDRNGKVIMTAAESCEERADVAKRLYSGSDMRMVFEAPHGQSIRLTETIPGQPYDRKGYQRQIRLDFMAAGLANVTSKVGDDSGPYIGRTLQDNRPVHHDSHFATEGRGELGRGNNMWAVVSALGGGKTVLGEAIAYNGARRGIKVVAWDPSGPMDRLCDMPEMKGISTKVNLLTGEPGILSPPALVREPNKDEFPDSEAGRKEYDKQVATARAERGALAVDAARRSLDSDLYSHPKTKALLREARRGVDWTQHASLWDLVDMLTAMNDPDAKELAFALNDASQMPILSLLFPDRSSAGDMAGAQHKSTLTIISTPGIKRAPAGVERTNWNAKEMAADSILRLAAFYADRELFGKTMHERAIALFDEAEDFTDDPIGRAFFSRLGRDHSKWNIAAYLLLKSISDEILTGELRNFLAGAFVGRIANREVAETMLTILNIQDKAYAMSLMRLSEREPGQFVHLDAVGQVGAFKVDVDYHPTLAEAIFTNPTPEGAENW
jgi:hypothetical protein